MEVKLNDYEMLNILSALKIKADINSQYNTEKYNDIWKLIHKLERIYTSN